LLTQPFTICSVLSTPCSVINMAPVTGCRLF
jgi:hypothetical protein